MTEVVTSIPIAPEDDPDQLLERARRSVAAGADLIEWRVDGVTATSHLDLVRPLLASSPAPSIVTSRIDDDELLEFVEWAVLSPHPPRYIDVELESYTGDLVAMVRSAPETELIISHHDFDGRPDDVDACLDRLGGVAEATILKLVWQAHSLRDNLDAFRLLREVEKPAAIFCMGDFGVPSRILAPKFGGRLTYAASSDDLTTAPGQLAVGTLIERYRFREISESTRVLGIVGSPVTHSRGPDVHNRAFGIPDAVYLRLPIREGETALEENLGALIDDRYLDFLGASVTLPHKENLLRFVARRGDPLADDVKLCGAANTLSVHEDHTLSCHNTDLEAARELLDEHVRDETRAVVLGAGGVARAVVAALSRLGAEITIVNRTQRRADQLAADLSVHGDAPIAAIDADKLRDREFDVLVNCTSIGMSTGPAPGDSPLPEDVPLTAEHVVFDTVYEPAMTPLLRRADSVGATTIGGLAMFLRQAARQFELWTGSPAPEIDAASFRELVGIEGGETP